jgi:hypothetical protein
MAETATRKEKSQSKNLGHAFIRLINLTQITISFLVLFRGLLLLAYGFSTLCG